METPTTLPVTLVNRALDDAGYKGDPLGDLTQGDFVSRLALRNYDSTLRQMCAAAHWNFLRRETQMELLGDATQQFNQNKEVPKPWTYMYRWPVDCVNPRFVKKQFVNGFNPDGSPTYIAIPSWNSPTPFIVGDAPLPNDADSDWQSAEGHSPESTRVVLTNQLGATLVYTGIIQYPDAWDPLFEQALVALLAARFALPVNRDDRKFGMVMRRDNIQIAREALNTARIRDGNEGWTIQDHTPDWIRARTGLTGYWGTGLLFYPWSTIPMLDDAGGSY